MSSPFRQIKQTPSSCLINDCIERINNSVTIIPQAYVGEGYLATTKFCRAVASRRRCRPHSSCPLALLTASSPFGRISSSPEMLRISGDPSGLPWTPASQFRYRSPVSWLLLILSKICLASTPPQQLPHPDLLAIV